MVPLDLGCIATVPTSGATGESQKEPPLMATPDHLSDIRLLPDLRVTEVEAGTPSFEDNGNEANVPLKVTIKNFGGSTSNSFKISTDVIVGDGGRFVNPFSVPGQDDVWYPWQEGLGAGKEATFSGDLHIGHPSGTTLVGEVATIIATADSCSGDEFMPDYCRVEESNEENNEMGMCLASFNQHQ